MVLRSGISELYVDIMLTLIVISVSGAFTALITNLSNYSRSTQSLDVGVPPLALIIRYSGSNYLVVVNYEGDSREFALIRGGVKVGSYLIPPQGLLILNIGNAEPSEIYVLVGNYLVRANFLELR
ncbi:MAG: hypothetical protein N3G48_00025 [Sulfolobales archaeon]|nr:hypothetical protein [Sulfolobales archaeon]